MFNGPDMPRYVFGEGGCEVCSELEVIRNSNSREKRPSVFMSC